MNIQNDIQDTLEYYIRKAPKLNSGYKQKRSYVMFRIAPLLILSKYQNYCNIIDLDLTINTEKYGPVLTKELSLSKINEIANSFKKCLNNGSNIISFSVTIGSTLGDAKRDDDTSLHANVMIYKSNINTFQYFEPHGANFIGDEKYTERIGNVLTKLFNELVSRKIIPSNWKYDNSEATCPTVTGKGFQAFESEIKKQCYGKENIKGFCSSWSNFILEMYLKYPNLDIKQVLTYSINAFRNISIKDYCAIQKFIASYDNENRKYILSFLDNKVTDEQLNDSNIVNFLEKAIINKLFSAPEDREQRIPVEKYTQKKKYKQVGTCVNIKTGTVNDVVQYILTTPDNIVIAVDDFIGCYKRSDIIGDLNDYKFTEINNIRVEFSEDKSSGNLSPIRRLEKDERVNILHKNIEYHRIYPDMYVSDEDLKKLKNFNNVFFNFVLQYEDFYPTIYKVLSYTLEDYLMEEEIETNVPKTTSETIVSKTTKSKLYSLDNPLIFNKNTNYYD